MKKVLFVATVAKTHIVAFHLETLRRFRERGFETHVAAANDFESCSNIKIPHCDVFHEVPFSRNPFHVKNFTAYRKLKEIMEKENFDLIHCHTPVGGVLCRLAAMGSRKRGTKVFYTAHGFHFYHGAPLCHWLLYYPAEILCSYVTDVLFTINREDYDLAKKHMHAKRICYLCAGAGVDLSKYFYSAKTERNSNVLKLLSVGEINKNKNHEAVLRAMALCRDRCIEYTVVGKGDTKSLQKLTKKFGLEKRIHFLGYQTDLTEIYKDADIFVFPSKREGLPVSLMEAMASGLPAICSDIRGNRDLIDENGGFLYPVKDISALAKAIERLAEDRSLQRSMGEYNANKACAYDRMAMTAHLFEIYDMILNGDQ